MPITILGVVITNHTAFLVHVYLLSGDVLATIAVGAGIVWEHGSPDTRRVADRLVIWGVVAETLCSIALFSFDETISGAQQATIEAQQSKIIALETHFVPRLITSELIERLAKDVLPLIRASRAPAIGALPATLDNLQFAFKLASVLDAQVNQGAAEVQVGPVRGVIAKYVTLNEQGKKLAEAFAQALNDSDIPALAVPGLMEQIFHPSPKNPSTVPLDPTLPENSWVVIVVGEKP